jgi:hypothetical protein
MFSRRFLDFGSGLRAALPFIMASSVSGCLSPSPSTVVQRVLQKYTGPAVAVGASVREVRTSLGVPFEFVPHLGYVAHVGDSTGVSELRLLLPRGARTGPRDDDDRPDAVEILTTSDDAFNTLAVEISSFFREPPTEGCLTTMQPGNYREVRYWMAPRRNGGIALTNDYGGNRVVAHRGMVVTGLLAFAGPFRGGETMRGNYSPQPCAVVTGLVR